MVCLARLIISLKLTEQRSPDTHRSPVNTFGSSPCRGGINAGNTQCFLKPLLHVSSVPRSHPRDPGSSGQREGHHLPQHTGTRGSGAGLGTRRAPASLAWQHHLEAQLKQARSQLCCPTCCPSSRQHGSLSPCSTPGTSQNGARVLPGPTELRIVGHAGRSRNPAPYSAEPVSCSAPCRQSASSHPQAGGERGHAASAAASLPQLTFADSEVRPANGLLHDVRRDRAHFPPQQLPLLPRQLFH